jgi:hypothetical protein
MDHHGQALHLIHFDAEKPLSLSGMILDGLPQIRKLPFPFFEICCA